jgi:ATP-dependent Clp protease ATP-binding subunit ClpA
VTLEVTEEAEDFLAREGFDPAFGARPLKRAIQRAVQDPLALWLLDAEVPEGTRVVVRPAPDGGKLTFEAIPPAGEAASP